jgi:hypothetical protein
MKKLLFLALLAFTSCSKDELKEESYVKASILDFDIIANSKKIVKNYDAANNKGQISFYIQDSYAYIFNYDFKLSINGTPYIYEKDFRVSQASKNVPLQGFIGKLTKSGDRITGNIESTTAHFKFYFDFKNYQLY